MEVKFRRAAVVLVFGIPEAWVLGACLQTWFSIDLFVYGRVILDEVCGLIEDVNESLHILIS